MFRPGLCSVTFRPLPVAEVVRLAAEAGLAGIEWGSDVHVPPDQPALAQTVQRQTADAGLTVASYGSYYRLGEAEPHPFERYVETALALQTPTIRVWAGRQGSAEVTPAGFSEQVADAQRIGDLAAAAGLRVAFEFHGHTRPDSAASARRLLEAVAHPAVGIYWQMTIGRDLAFNLAELRTVEPWVTNLHCFYWRGEPREPLLLADGTEDWRTVLAHLRPGGTGRWVLLEFVRGGEVEAFRADARTLRALVEA